MIHTNVQRKLTIATIFVFTLLFTVTLGFIVAQGQPASANPKNDPALAQIRGQQITIEGDRLPAALRNLDPNQMTSVYIVLEGAPAAQYALMGDSSPLGLAEAQSGQQLQVSQRINEIETQQAALRPRLAALGAQEMYSYQVLANAIQVRVPAGQLEQLAALPGVLRIDPVGRYSVQNASSVPFIGAPAVWEPSAAGATGAGVKVGIIDTGIDYFHADLGGSGIITDYITGTTGINPTVITDTAAFPSAKVVGGYDFVGDDYDAGDPANSTPQPDPDPVDCNGHGTHVSGTTAGYGVLTNGATYTGAYTGTMDFNQFQIGPGVAPNAELYGLKVFGCSGSTEMVTAAYEWAADPNGDGDLSDHLDVLNLSLGCDFSCGSPTEIQMTNFLAELGVFMAIAAGNDGNTFYAQGDPASSARAMSVAASIDGGIIKNGINVITPSATITTFEAVEAAFSKPLADTGPVTKTVTYAEPANGCSALTNGAAISGTIALIDRGSCFFTTKFINAMNANAAGVIVVNNVPGEAFVMGGTPTTTITIPGVMISLDDGAVIKADLSASNTVTAGLSADIVVPRPDLADQIADFSSRGPGSPDGRLKPEISAPGFSIVSAAVGKGTEGVSFSGTSMATPHIAGVAALVKEAQPNLSVEQMKAAMMNTAVENRDADGNLYPESRVGAGRVQVDRAASITVTAVAEGGQPGAVGLSLGALTLNEVYTTTRAVRLTNYGSADVTYNLSVSQTVTETGVSVTPLLTSVTVPANGSATVPVQFVIDPAQLDMTTDPTTPGTQLGLPRHTLIEASGQIRFNGAPAIHLPYYMTVYPGAEMYATSLSQSLTGGTGVITTTISLTGTAAHDAPIATLFELGAESDNQNNSDPYAAMADLLAVGAASDVPSYGFSNGAVYFGIATAGEWTTPQPHLAEFDIYVDTDFDGFSDYVIFNYNYGGINGVDDTDTFITAVYDLNTGSLTIDSFVNLFSSSTDTAVYNNNVIVMPVSADSLGLSPGNAAFSYYVVSSGGGSLVDISDRATFDAENPVVDTGLNGMYSTPFYADGTDVEIAIDRGRLAEAGYTASNPPKVMVLHHMNTDTNWNPRLEIVTLNFSSYDFTTFLPLMIKN